MRKLGILLAASALAVGLWSASRPASAKTTKPVTLDGKVNAKGTKDISGKSSASLELEADDYYFSPTFVKVAAGREGHHHAQERGRHARTPSRRPRSSVDKQVSSGKSKKITVTVPSSGSAFQFHCDFHDGMGMQGAFFTKTGGNRRVVAGVDALLTPESVSEEAPLRTRVGVVVVGDVAHVVVDVVLDGERLPGHPAQLLVHVLEVRRRAVRCRGSATRPSARNRSRTPRSSTRRPRGTRA